MTRGGGRPTKLKAATMDEALLDAARRSFCERGFAGTTIDHVAAALRWSKHTIYSRHANKLELLQAVVERDVVRFVSALDAAGARHVDPLDALHEMAGTYFRFSASAEYSALYATVTLEAARSKPLQKQLKNWVTASLQPLLVAMSKLSAGIGQDASEAMRSIELLVDLLDGEANRLKWNGSADDPEAMKESFERRWGLFTAIVLPDCMTAN